jgi:hypothetical protein
MEWSHTHRRHQCPRSLLPFRCSTGLGVARGWRGSCLHSEAAAADTIVRPASIQSLFTIPAEPRDGLGKAFVKYEAIHSRTLPPELFGPEWSDELGAVPDDQ